MFEKARRCTINCAVISNILQGKCLVSDQLPDSPKIHSRKRGGLLPPQSNESPTFPSQAWHFPVALLPLLPIAFFAHANVSECEVIFYQFEARFQ